MAVLETLEILIEADRSGLDSQLKRASSSITSFVQQMNRQEVSWTQILSKSITPALIGSIASTFAIAVTQALSFQQQLAAANAQGTQSFADQSESMKGSFYNLGNAVGQTAGDMASSMAMATRAFGDTNGIAEVVAKSAGMLATMGFGSVTDETQLLIDVLRQWNVDSAPKAEQAIDGLFQASKNGVIGFNDLTKTVTEGGSALRNDTSISDTAAAIQSVASAAGMTADDAKTAFKAIADAVQDPLKPSSVLLNSFRDMKTAIDKDGINAAFLAISDFIDQHPRASAQLLGQQMGLTANAVSDFRDVGVQKLKEFMDEEDQAIAKTKTLAESFNQFKTENPFAGLMAKIENFFGEMFQKLGEFFGKLFGAKSFSDVANAFGGDFQNITTPATLGLQTPSSNVQGNGTQFNIGAANNPFGVTNNYNINQNMQINAPAGSEKQTGEGILNSAYQAAQR